MVLSSLEKETDRQYFFSRLKNPLWIQPLADRGRFSSPPNIRHLPNGYVQFPFWPELEYLKNICKDGHSDIVDNIIQIVLELPPVDNPIVYEEIVEMALHLDGLRSARLKPKVLEYASLDRQFRVSIYPRLLRKWTTEGQTKAALELANILVQFVPDPRAEEKQKQERQLNVDGISSVEDEFASMMTILRPLPRFNENYQEILDEGVRPLMEKEPYKVAGVLMDAVATMIRLGKHEEDLESETSRDYSESWCPRLNEQSQEYRDPEKTLVNTLTHACERIYKQPHESIEALDDALKRQRWDVFKRLRQHLYAFYPSEQTKPWIQEMVRAHSNYGRWKHKYEFQRMIRLACEHFGEELLTEDERSRIFDAILCGPPEEDFREWLGDQFTETDFEQRRKTFHRQQLMPFATVLFGKYQRYLQQLQADETAEEITDESYLTVSVSGEARAGSRSPKSSEELANLQDEALLDYINEWQDEHWDVDDRHTEISIDALAGAFQEVFEHSIIPIADRLNFWIENRGNIRRPIYVRAIVDAIKDHVKAKNFDKLDEWFAFCLWVLTHPDPDNEELDGIGRLGDGSREQPRWHTSRRAVCDFVETCVDKDVDVPIGSRKNLTGLLEMLCTQYDWRLDRDGPVLLNRDDQLTEAMDTTRGQALENLFEFGFWVHRRDDKADVSEMKAILEKRFGAEAEYPLTLPEYAILGMQFGSLVDLDKEWAVAIRSLAFPQNDLTAWREAFGNFLRYSRPYKPIFDTIRGDFEFAVEHLDCLKKLEWTGGKSTGDFFGQHLFSYYLWHVYPLTGERSLLNRFYLKTDGEREHWATLFDYVGHSLRNTGKDLDEGLKDRIVAFFEWRLEEGEPTELQRFVFWLEAECLEADWRLNAYSRILDLLRHLNWDQWKNQPVRCPSFAIRSISKMIPAYTTGAVECLAKLMNSMPTGGAYYIPTDDARTILKAGRDHDDETVRKNADEIRENMLKRGFLSVLD